jgi:shikimate dehydrogenase
MTVTGAAKLAAVIGHPVRHSLSPRLHNYWLSRYALDGIYLPLDIAPDDLASCLSFMQKAGFRGANLTVPHKEAVLAHCAVVDETVIACGAANTIWLESGQWHATNTDVYGYRTHLCQTLGVDSLTGKRAVVLGAGGAARAVILALQQLGVGGITLINRDLARAETLQRHFPAISGVCEWQDAAKALEGADLLINTTVLGMKGKEPLTLDLAPLAAQAVVSDIVYAPLETPLLQRAHARGLRTVDGLGMLLHQAVDGFARWFGVRPEVDDATRHTVLEGLA